MLDLLFFFSATFLHVPLMVLFGGLLFLAWRGLILTSQAEELRGVRASFEFALKDLEAEHTEVKSLLLERANLKDELKALHEYSEHTQARIDRLHNVLERRNERLKGAQELLEILGVTTKSDALSLKSQVDHAANTASKLSAASALIEEQSDAISRLRESSYDQHDIAFDEDDLGEILDDALRDHMTTLAYDVANDILADVIDRVAGR